MNSKAVENLLLNRTKTKIIETAERLFAEKGINNVSTREIAREAGQKNHSALHYHFGDKESLLDALLDYRLIPLDNRRKILLNEAVLKSKSLNLRELITVLITPLAERALDPKKDNYILKIMGELLTSADWRKKYALRGDKGPTAIKVTNMISEGDQVSTQLDATADGLEAKFGHFHKLQDGKIKEFWIYDDSQKMARVMKAV